MDHSLAPLNHSLPNFSIACSCHVLIAHIDPISMSLWAWKAPGMPLQGGRAEEGSTRDLLATQGRSPNGRARSRSICGHQGLGTRTSTKSLQLKERSTRRAHRLRNHITTRHQGSFLPSFLPTCPAIESYRRKIVEEPVQVQCFLQFLPLSQCLSVSTRM